MQTGAIISGGAHAALISLAFLSGLDFWPSDPPELRITEVTLVRAELFDTVTSAAPAMPMLDLEVPDLPDTAFDAPVAPLADDAPIETEMDQTEDPEAADADPDLTALLDVVQPDVSNVLDAVVAPSFDDAAPEIFQPAQDGNELNAAPISIAPPPPRNAPRIDTTAAARPPQDALPNIDTTPAADDGPAETVEDQQQDATAAPESTTEITPEGQEDVEIANFAPVTAARPPRRPPNLRIPVEEPEDNAQEDAILAAIEQAEREAAEAAEQPVQAELTGAEAAAIGDAIEWSSVAFSGQANIEDYQIVVSVDIDSTGRVIGEIKPIEPSTLDGIYKLVFRDARIGILRLGQFPLPAGKFPNGATLHLRFDPASGAVGMN